MYVHTYISMDRVRSTSAVRPGLGSRTVWTDAGADADADALPRSCISSLISITAASVSMATIDDQGLHGRGLLVEAFRLLKHRSGNKAGQKALSHSGPFALVASPCAHSSIVALSRVDLVTWPTATETVDPSSLCQFLC